MRPFTPRQTAENARFLQALARTGNVRLACQALGLNRSTYFKRRARSPAFAAAWDAAIRVAEVTLLTAENRHSPDRAPAKARGGEPRLTRLSSGRVQLRRSRPGAMTRADEQLFFHALSATANVRLAAAAAGFAHSSFYARARADPAFAREMRLALETGYTRLKAALFAAASPESHEGDAWRQGDLPPLPPLTADEVLQLLHLHEKSVCQGWEQPHRKRRKDEPWEVYGDRLRAMYAVQEARNAEAESLYRASRTRPRPSPDAPDPEDTASRILRELETMRRSRKG
jgi:hypothetical protein